MQHHIEEYPGYTWNWIPALGQWVMKWGSIDTVYSPPVLDESMNWYHVSVPDHIKSPGILKPSPDMQIAYMYYRKDLHKIEIWSSDIGTAIIRLTNYLYSIKPQQKILKN